MITAKLLDPRDEKVERNPKLTKSKFEKVKLFNEANP